MPLFYPCFDLLTRAGSLRNKQRTFTVVNAKPTLCSIKSSLVLDIFLQGSRRLSSDLENVVVRSSKDSILVIDLLQMLKEVIGCEPRCHWVWSCLGPFKFQLFPGLVIKVFVLDLPTQHRGKHLGYSFFCPLCGSGFSKMAAMTRDWSSAGIGAWRAAGSRGKATVPSRISVAW